MLTVKFNNLKDKFEYSERKRKQHIWKRFTIEFLKNVSYLKLKTQWVV